MLPYKPQSYSKSLSQLLAEFPRKHLAIASAVLGVTAIMLLVLPSKPAEAKRISQPLAIEITPKPDIEPTVQATPTIPWKDITVKKGDNLSKIFHRAGLGPSEVHHIIHSTPEAKQLTRLYPGQVIAFQVDAEGLLVGLSYQQDLLNTTRFERDGEGFKVHHEERQPEVRQRWKTATISSSLYKAADNAGVEQDLIMELANIFGGVIDFVYDVRVGDHFNLLYEERYIDGKKLGNGDILAAQFSNQGAVYNAFRYTYANGDVGYYNEHGVSMRKAFLRAPLDFNRISSRFNPKRLHPVFKTVRPHRGIDYAAPRGTPVYAAGDGRITRAGYSKANGNFIVIKHGEQYTTKYLHLHKRAVRRGQKVKQQQIIGWVGSTGYATGPHLHYEFLVNGVHRNPRTILQKLPKAESIAAADKARFLTQIGSLQMQLAAYNNHHKLAKAESSSDNKTL